MIDVNPPQAAEYIRFLPEIILVLAGTVLMVFEGITHTPVQKRILGYFALASIAVAMLGGVAAYNNSGQAFRNMLTVDAYGTFFTELVLGVGFFCLLSAFEYLRREGAETGEFYALVLFSLVGQCIMATANDLLMVFIGLEVSSIATYILAGFLRSDRRNNESALKYFLLGSFATAFLLYGTAWIYGIMGSTNLDEMQRLMTGADRSLPVALIGMAAALTFVGFAFKVSAAPFQSWAPDVYQGAPAPVSAFLSAGPKAAAFAVFFRVFMTAFGPIHVRWVPLVWACALLTMIIGNFAALAQTNIKRLIAYSSIAHAGYILVALTADSQLGMAAMMFYLASYGLMNVGIFAVINHVANRHEKFVHISDFAGLGKREPATAALLTVFVLSLIGVPLTGGFFAKFYVFRAALDSHLIWLTVLGLLNSAVAAYYYLKILAAVYMQEPGEATNTLQPLAPGLRLTIWATAFGTLLLGIFPSALIDFVSNSAATVVGRLGQ